MGTGESDSFRCSRCRQVHLGLPLSYNTPAPVYVLDLTETERRERVRLSEDLCEFRDEQGWHYFINGLIQIPLLDGPEPYFSWGVWVSLSDTNYERTLQQWQQPGRESEPPSFGWLSTALPYDPSTINLKTNVHMQPVGERPLIELEPTNHPLAVEQRDGITRERVREIAEQVLHG